MKKVLKNNEKTRNYLESLPKIYLICRGAGFGIREFPYAGKCDESGIPYVWDYEDFNGTCDEYRLRKITSTTTGFIYGWSIYKTGADELAKMGNTANGQDWRNKLISEVKQ